MIVGVRPVTEFAPFLCSDGCIKRTPPKTDPALRRLREADITAPFSLAVAGSAVFERAVDACGADPMVATVLVETLQLIGSSPHRMTLAELADILPELDRRLRLLVPPEAAQRHVARLRALVLSGEDDG